MAPSEARATPSEARGDAVRGARRRRPRRVDCVWPTNENYRGLTFASRNRVRATAPSGAAHALRSESAASRSRHRAGSAPPSEARCGGAADRPKQPVCWYLPVQDESENLPSKRAATPSDARSNAVRGAR